MKTSIALLMLLAGAATSTGALADDKAGQDKSTVCVACHGSDGNSPSAAFPSLAGQNARYIYLQLRDFKEGRRKNELMSPMAAGLAKQDMLDLADYFSHQKKKPTGFQTDPAKVASGRGIADAALCPMCHLGGFSGQNEIPRVAGQHYDYVVLQLKNFRGRLRTNDGGNMTAYAKSLTDEQIDDLAHYIASLN